MPRLRGKVAIVTGAGRGVGRSIAEVFAREGATVIATSRGKEGDYADAPSGVEYHRLDVSNAEAWERVVTAVVDRHGRVDVLADNAGIITYEPVHELTVEDWELAVAVNQTGTRLGMRAVIPRMLAQGGGSIINVSSIWGSAAVAGRTPITPPKAPSATCRRTPPSHTRRTVSGSTRCIRASSSRPSPTPRTPWSTTMP